MRRPDFGSHPSRALCVGLILTPEHGGLTGKLNVKYNPEMGKKSKPITVAEAGRRGGTARAKKYSRQQLREWARLGGRPKGLPRKSDKRAKKARQR